MATVLAKCHEKVANARADFQHKLSRTLVDENQAVIVETLKSANMMKNRKLAKHIADASWHSFVAKLEYKLKEQGKHLVKLEQWYASSKTCHCCGHKVEEMPLSVRKWDCPSCGTTDIDRDLNAALNIRDKGILELKAAGRSFLLMEAA
ncbi:transposase [Vibrio parahaemolyticus]|nr:transposase [Vibrio diabolicus]MCS0260331.1 transposase [Vibrio parahaemolyticus]